MKQRIRFIAVASLVALSMLACQVVSIAPAGGTTVRGSGNVVEETRAMSGLTSVELATIGTLHIQVGDSESLRVEAEDNLMPYLETEVRGGRLSIENREGVNLQSTRPIHYYLTVTALDTIAISSSGDVEAPDLQADRFSVAIHSSGNLEMGNLQASTLTVNITSSGNVTMGTLNADTLEVDISSSGNLRIAGGEVGRQTITISSSGEYTAQDLQSAEADVRLSSSGSATIRVHDRLRANLTSSGDVRYAGSPTVDATTTSSGNAVQIGE
jgi:uncharacterized protein with GYD domain